jgi:hypothetical protein
MWGRVVRSLVFCVMFCRTLFGMSDISFSLDTSAFSNTSTDNKKLIILLYA